VIAVVGRPGLTDDARLDRPAALICVAAALAGGSVELVGSVGDDGDGDAAVVELGRVGIGHAAVLRDPAAATPRPGAGDDNLPRLDAADIELALRYLADCQVLVVAEPLPADAMRVVVDAASYHRAALVVLTQAAQEGDGNSGGGLGGDPDAVALPEDATVLETPEEDDGAFAQLVAHYAVRLADGRRPADAWRDAIEETGWEQGSA
jgi:hypothetical protein